jgi:GT2 family glycosyltransferase
MRIPPAGFVGDSISALGFPAGGNAGYDTMFPVAADGTTTNLAGGNCALRATTVRELGGYDETMTFGGEDTELAWHFTQADKRIVWVRTAVMEHPARTSLREFCRWQYVRGRAKRQFSRKVPAGGFVGNRLRSMGRILANNARDPKIVLIAPLLGVNLFIQQVGFLAELARPTPPPSGE